MTPQLGFAPRWRYIAWLRGSKRTTSRQPEKRAGRGSRLETLWASPANPCTPNTTRSHHDHRNRCARGATPLVHLYAGSDCLLYTSDAADEEDSVDLGG